MVLHHAACPIGHLLFGVIGSRAQVIVPNKRVLILIWRLHMAFTSNWNLVAHYLRWHVRHLHWSSHLWGSFLLWYHLLSRLYLHLLVNVCLARLHLICIVIDDISGLSDKLDLLYVLIDEALHGWLCILRLRVVIIVIIAGIVVFSASYWCWHACSVWIHYTEFKDEREYQSMYRQREGKSRL